MIINTRITFKEAILVERPLQIAGVINAYCALLAKRADFNALYLSGAGIANACYGIPDIGLLQHSDVIIEAHRITQASKLPLLVDLDTGFEDQITAQDLMKKLNEVHVSAIQIEDQVQNKRCGHLEGKQLISIDKMRQRLSEFIKFKNEYHIEIMARTDAYMVEGFDATLSRIIEYQDAGCDSIFVESIKTIEEYSIITKAVTIPVLANITEFGQTPLFTVEQLDAAGVAMILYPLSAFRAMNLSALTAYHSIKQYGTQQNIIKTMQTREQLYEVLNYTPSENNDEE